jgi:hypothetical protein
MPLVILTCSLLQNMIATPHDRQCTLQGCTPFIGPAQFSNSSSSSNGKKKQKRSHNTATATTTAAAATSTSAVSSVTAAAAEIQEDAAVIVLWGDAPGFKPDKKVKFNSTHNA